MATPGQSAHVNRDPSEHLAELESRPPNLFLLIRVRQTGAMQDSTEDADALSAGCGREAPHVNATVSVAEAVLERRRRVLRRETWRSHLEPDPQAAIAIDLASLDDLRIDDQRGTCSCRRDGE